MNSWVFLIMGTVVPVVFFAFFRIISNVKKCYEYSNNIPISDFSEAISIIKPMKGGNEFTFINFLSWINQDNKSNSPIEYIFSYDKGDSGIKYAQAVQYTNKKILSNPIIEGFTGKMSALVQGLKNSSYDLLIFSDGDTRALKGYYSQDHGSV